jgi:hypothetical protein
MADAALIQEPWIYSGQIRDLTYSKGRVFSVTLSGDVRSCIFIKNHINALPLSEFCFRDATMVRITGGDRGELVVTSAYIPYTNNEPSTTAIAG